MRTRTRRAAGPSEPQTSDSTAVRPGETPRAQPGPLGEPRDREPFTPRRTSAREGIPLARGPVARPTSGSFYARGATRRGGTSAAKRPGCREESGRDPGLDRRPEGTRVELAEQTPGRAGRPGQLLLLPLRKEGLEDGPARRRRRDGEAGRAVRRAEIAAEVGGVLASGMRRADRRGHHGHQQRQCGGDADSSMKSSVGHSQRFRTSDFVNSMIISDRAKVRQSRVESQTGPGSFPPPGGPGRPLSGRRGRKRFGGRDLGDIPSLRDPDSGPLWPPDLRRSRPELRHDLIGSAATWCDPRPSQATTPPEATRRLLVGMPPVGLEPTTR